MGFTAEPYKLDLLPIKSTVDSNTKLVQYRSDINFTSTIVDSLIDNSTGELQYIYLVIKGIISDIIAKINTIYAAGASGQEKIGDIGKINGINELTQQYVNNVNKAKSIAGISGSGSLFGVAAISAIAALVYFYLRR